MHEEEEICAIHSSNKANARLIAAAPELLEALRGLLEYADFVRHDTPCLAGKRNDNLELKNARAAIAKAAQL